jgi:prepilin-type N-terminal cleavage/methylation domain-containing protein/prepilin-type processing-associated H-X9-DG protein
MSKCVRRRLRRGFTLVELLVVIGIIAVLIGILLPAISRARDHANTTSCMATLRTLGQLCANYSVEFNGSLPYGRYTTPGATSNSGQVDDGQNSSFNQHTLVWWSVLRKYMKRGSGSNWDNATFTQEERFMAAFNCATANNRIAGCDFGCNPMLMPDRDYEGAHRWGGPTPTFGPNVGITQGHQIYKPGTTKQLTSDVAVLWDACELAPNFDKQYCVQYGVDSDETASRTLVDGVSYYNFRFRGNPGIANDPQFGDSTFVDPGSNKDRTGNSLYAANIRWRHGRGTAANFLMGDWSVRTFKITTTDASGATKGELKRLNIRPKAPNYYIND